MTDNVTKLPSRKVSSLTPFVSEEARKARGHHLLLGWFDEHKDLGAEYLIEKLSGVMMMADGLK